MGLGVVFLAFKSNNWHMGKFEGKLLIAVPDLQDMNFLRTVVLVLHHDQFGASGVVLNRPTDTRVSDLVSQLELPIESVTTLTERLHVGGPVEGPLIVLHDDRDLSEESVIPGVFISTRRDLVEQLLATDGLEMRLFSGYSGWASEQLENEVEHGGWLILDADRNHVFGSADSLWKVVCDQFGDDVCQLPQSQRNDDGAMFDPGLN